MFGEGDEESLAQLVWWSANFARATTAGRRGPPQQV